MDEMNCFVIEGSKKLIFRKEDDRYICFDPEGLEFYEVNETAACILFLVAEKQKYYDLVTILCDWFELDRQTVEEYVRSFFLSFPMKKLIVSNLIMLGVPAECIIEKEEIKILNN